MSAQALVLCQDSQVLNVLQPVLAQTGVAATVCTGVSTAQAALSAARFNAVIVDCDGIESGTDFLQTVHNSGPNFESVALAIVRTLDGMHTAFAAGANLILWKPVSEQEAARVVRTTRGLSERRRRRFARASVPVLAYANIEGVPEPAIITELSEGGLGVQAFEPLEAQRTVRVHFTVPGSEAQIETMAEVAWADASGRAGLCFTALPESAVAQIRDWISGESTLLTATNRGAIAASHSHFAVSNATKQIVSALLDAILIGGAVALFTLIYYGLTRTIAPAGFTALVQLATFVVLWLAYRFVFFRDPAPTPGAVVTERICRSYFDTPERPIEVSASTR